MSFLGAFSQQKLKITIKDKSTNPKKTLILIPAVLGNYYNNFTRDSANLKDNSYNFYITKTDTNFPKPYQLVYEIVKNKSYGGSEIFFLPSRTNMVYFNSETDKIKNNKNEKIVKDGENLSFFLNHIELERNKLNKIKQLSYRKNGISGLLQKTIDSLAADYQKISIKEDSLLLVFSKKNPNSISLFWKIVGKISNNEYNEKFNELYKNFSPKIRNSVYGQILKQDLEARSSLEVEKVFPQIYFENKNVTYTLGKKYTLIDFWFSYCAPCLEEIPKYKELYSKYKNKGFEIVAISSDRIQDISNWKNTIDKNDIVWQNFYDNDKKETKKYNINSFPTTFLLDSDGKIIKKNISQEELKAFLEVNLKNN